MALSATSLVVLCTFFFSLETEAHVSSPLITPAPKILPSHIALQKRAGWVTVCPQANITDCHVIGVGEVTTVSEGHYVPACNDHGEDCHYIGYADPTSPISGSTSYIYTSSPGGEPFIIPIPPVLPPDAPLPIPPVPPPDVPEDLPDPPTGPDADDGNDEEPELTKTSKDPDSTTGQLTSTTKGPTSTTKEPISTSNGLTSTQVPTQSACSLGYMDSITQAWGSSSIASLLFLNDSPVLPNGPQAGQAPNCTPHGAPWWSPTSWCECEGSTFSELSSMRTGQSEANCAYRTLPATQISPSTTASPPTNIPGIGGVPGCAYVIYGDGQACLNANYCNCGGTPAPLLTDGTSTHCNYKTVPTSKCPPPTTTKAPTPTTTEAHTGTITCFTSVGINTASVADLVKWFCNGEAAYGVGGATVNAAAPTAANYDIPHGGYKAKMNDVSVALFADREGCENAEMDLGKSSEACSSYMAQITDSCSKDGGAVTSAGCYDWTVRGFKAGCPDCTD